MSHRSLKTCISLHRISVCPFIMDMGLVRMVENCFHELRRNEIYAFAVPHHEISRHHSHATDSHGDVECPS